MIASHHQMQNTLLDVDRMVATIRAVVCLALDSEAVFRCEVCLSEVLTNIVRHTKTDAPIDLIVTERPDAMIIEFLDPAGAEAFDPRDHAIELEQIDPFAENGRGLGLILHCADGVDYGSNGDRNRLALTFNKVATARRSAKQSGENHDRL